MSVYDFGNYELLDFIKETALKKVLSEEEVFNVVDKALTQATSLQYGGVKLVVHIDRKSGKISVYRRLLVVEDSHQQCDVEEEILPNNTQVCLDEFADTTKYGKLKKVKYEDMITLSDAKADFQSNDIKIGSIITQKLPFLDLRRSQVSQIRLSINSLITKLLQEKQYNEFKNRVGDIVNGVVRKIEKGKIWIDINGNEAIMYSSSAIKNEYFKNGDRIKAVIEKVRKCDHGTQIFLSRSSPKFLEELLKQEIPEIYDGVVEVVKIARDAGSKSKVAVYSADRNVDAVGACIGLRGTRIKGIIANLNNEKVDVIEYSHNLQQFICNLFAPIPIVNIVNHELEKKIDLIISKDQLSLAIGRRGQNIRLNSDLIDMTINVFSEEDESKKRLEIFADRTQYFVECLCVEEIIAQLLVAEGYTNVSELANVAEIASIEGFDYEIARSIYERASEYIKKTQDDINTLVGSYKIDARIREICDLDDTKILYFFKNGIDTVEKIADMDSEELKEVFEGFSEGSKPTEELLNSYILNARKLIGMI